MNCLVEICCGSVNDAVAAYEGGALRVELNSDIFHGGLTPTIGALKAVKAHCKDLKVMCMVRPREGGFCYTDLEFEAMLLDAKELLANGADGIVFGFLKQDGTVDTDRCKKMMEVIGDKESVFHRAIDVVPDWKACMDALIELGVTRVLTSGQRAEATSGLETIKEMIEYADGRIQVLAGGSFTKENSKASVEKLGLNQMHIALFETVFDKSAMGNPEIYFGGFVEADDGTKVFPKEDRYLITKKEVVASFIDSLK